MAQVAEITEILRYLDPSDRMICLNVFSVLKRELGEEQGRHDYKIAAMAKTITYALEPRLYLSDLRFILLLVLGLMTAMSDFLLFGRQRSLGTP